MSFPDLKEVAPFYYEWLAHPPADPWWDWAELRGKYDRVHAARTEYFRVVRRSIWPGRRHHEFQRLIGRAEKPRRNPRTATIIGPWTHGELERSKAGRPDFGKSAAVDYDEIILRWMDRYLKGIDNGS